MSLVVLVERFGHIARTPVVALLAFVNRRTTSGGAVRVAVDRTPADGYLVAVRSRSSTPLANLCVRAPRADWEWVAWAPASEEVRGYATGTPATRTFGDQPPFVAHVSTGSVAFLLRPSAGSQLPHWLVIEWDDANGRHHRRRVVLQPESAWLS